MTPLNYQETTHAWFWPKKDVLAILTDNWTHIINTTLTIDSILGSPLSTNISIIMSYLLVSAVMFCCAKKGKARNLWQPSAEYIEGHKDIGSYLLSKFHNFHKLVFINPHSSLLLFKSAIGLFNSALFPYLDLPEYFDGAVKYVIVCHLKGLATRMCLQYILLLFVRN